MAKPENENSDLKPGDAHPELRRHFDSEDEALWGVLGVLDDGADKAGADFVARTLKRVQRSSETPAGRLLFFKRRSIWVAASVAVAIIAIVVFMPPGSTDPEDPRQNGNNHVAEDFSDVVDKLSGMQEEALLSLDVAAAEDDDLAWFGS
ncbi:MAG: hypothetical protein V3W41_06235 [Planctomycetota bacterium]